MNPDDRVTLPPGVVRTTLTAPATAACGVVTSTDVADTDDGVTVVDPNLTDDVKARFAPVMVIS